MVQFEDLQETTLSSILLPEFPLQAREVQKGIDTRGRQRQRLLQIFVSGVRVARARLYRGSQPQHLGTGGGRNVDLVDGGKRCIQLLFRGGIILLAQVKLI